MNNVALYLIPLSLWALVGCDNSTGSQDGDKTPFSKVEATFTLTDSLVVPEDKQLLGFPNSIFSSATHNYYITTLMDVTAQYDKDWNYLRTFDLSRVPFKLDEDNEPVRAAAYQDKVFLYYDWDEQLYTFDTAGNYLSYVSLPSLDTVGVELEVQTDIFEYLPAQRAWLMATYLPDYENRFQSVRYDASHLFSIINEDGTFQKIFGRYPKAYGKALEQGNLFFTGNRFSAELIADTIFVLHKVTNELQCYATDGTTLPGIPLPPLPNWKPTQLETLSDEQVAAFYENPGGGNLPWNDEVGQLVIDADQPHMVYFEYSQYGGISDFTTIKETLVCWNRHSGEYALLPFEGQLKGLRLYGIKKGELIFYVGNREDEAKVLKMGRLNFGS